MTEEMKKKEFEYWEKFNRKFNTPDDVPEIPILPIEELKEHVWPKLYEAGAIAKKDLIVGHVYLGNCRNASKAVWKENGTFEYMRYKWGFTYPEEINHFEDDDEYDVYVPIKDITEDNIEI